jgi:hypothetical protein
MKKETEVNLMKFSVHVDVGQIALAMALLVHC